MSSTAENAFKKWIPEGNLDQLGVLSKDFALLKDYSDFFCIHDFFFFGKGYAFQINFPGFLGSGLFEPKTSRKGTPPPWAVLWSSASPRSSKKKNVSEIGEVRFWALL